MGSRGDFDGSGDSATYSASQVESVLLAAGVDIQGETVNDFVGYCPFHGNRDTPSFSVSKAGGLYICFNPSCYVQGTLIELVRKLLDLNEFQARRLIIKMAKEENVGWADKVEKILKAPDPFEEFDQSKLDYLEESLWEHPEVLDYLKVERKFTDETLRHFHIGYSFKKDMVAVPMHDIKAKPIGIIGQRSSNKAEKTFKNSWKLPTSKTLWNIHRAKRTGDTVILCESSFDAMRIHQAGYPNVVACLGGNFSPYHTEQINRIFSTVVLMTDFDKKEKHVYPGCRQCGTEGKNLCVGHNPGRDLGMKIAKLLPTKRIVWAAFDDKIVYPHDAKDAGDMSDDEIRQCLRNAVPDFVYKQWNLY